jgi:hypothetical protein
MARVKITDSFKEIKHTSARYNFIVVDNSLGIYRDDPVPGGVVTTHCEHFDLFPDIFRVAMDSSILILNVIPELNDAARRKYPYLFNDTQLAQRHDFYATESPEKVPFDRMIQEYRQFITANGFSLESFFFQKRGGTGIVYYLVLKIVRPTAAQSGNN